MSENPHVLRYQLIWWSCTSAERRTVHQSLAETTEAYVAVVSPVWASRLRLFPAKPPVRCADMPVPDDVAQAQHDFDASLWSSPRLLPYYRKPFAVGACRVRAVKSGQRNSSSFVQVVQVFEREQSCWVHQDLVALCQVQRTAQCFAPITTVPTMGAICPLYPSIARTPLPDSLVIDANLSPSTFTPLVQAAAAAAAAESAAESGCPASPASSETGATTPETTPTRESEDVNHTLFWDPETLEHLERDEAACFFAAERVGYQAGLGGADGMLHSTAFFDTPLMSLYMFDIFRDMSLVVLAELRKQVCVRPSCIHCFQCLQALLGKYTPYLRSPTAVKTAFLLGFMVAHLEHQLAKPYSVVATANQIRGCILHFHNIFGLATTPQVTVLLDRLMCACQQDVHVSVVSLVRAFRTNQFMYSRSTPSCPSSMTLDE